MRYLHIKFTDAGLYIENNRKILGGRKVLLNDDNTFVFLKYDNSSVNIKTPIGVNQISNMLHAMLGLAPVPSKRQNVMTYYMEEFRNSELYDLAKNHTFIKYYTPYKYDETKTRGENMKNLKKLSQTIQLAKPAFDSHLNCKTFVNIDGKQTELNGNYNWNYFFRTFYTDEDYVLLNKLMKLFKDITGKDDVVKEYDSFIDFAFEIRKHSDDKRIISFLEDNKEDIDKHAATKNYYTTLFFKKKLKGNVFVSNKELNKINPNSIYTSRTPLFNNKAVDYSRVNFSGEIVIEIENEEIIDNISKYGKIPTILDGGLIEILGCRKYSPYPDWKDDFDKISE
jgi:hypothetical protein